MTCAEIFTIMKLGTETDGSDEKLKRQNRTARFSLGRSAKRYIFLMILALMLAAGVTGCGVPTEQAETVAMPETQEAPAQSVPQEREDTGEDQAIPDYWVEPLSAGTKAIRQAVQRAGMDKSAFLFYTDSHWNYNSGMSPRLLTHLYHNTPLNKVIFGGDIVQTEPDPESAEESDVMEYLWQWRSQIRELKHYSVVGNHDDGEDTNNLFSYEYVYTYLFAPEDSSEIKRGGYTYYYFDDASEKTRYLCLDTAYEGIYNMSADQIAFLTDSLISTPEGWHIVVAAHAWYAPDYENFVPGEPIGILDMTPHAATVAEVLDQYNARSGPFQGCGARVEFCIGGHLHRDYVGATPGGIPIVLCETDSKQVRSGLEYTDGTAAEAAVSGIVADYANGILSVIRIGRGSSFDVPLGTGEVPEQADSGDYTNVLDTVGFMENCRLSAGSGAAVVNANTDLSGLIPVKKGDVVRLKNIIMLDTKDNYYAVIGYYDTDQSYLLPDFMHSGLQECAPDYDEDGNLTAFTVTNDQAAFLRICAKKIDDTSVVTVNEKIE